MLLGQQVARKTSYGIMLFLTRVVFNYIFRDAKSTQILMHYRGYSAR